MLFRRWPLLVKTFGTVTSESESNPFLLAILS